MKNSGAADSQRPFYARGILLARSSEMVISKRWRSSGDAGRQCARSHVREAYVPLPLALCRSPRSLAALVCPSEWLVCQLLFSCNPLTLHPIHTKPVHTPLQRRSSFSPPLDSSALVRKLSSSPFTPNTYPLFFHSHEIAPGTCYSHRTGFRDPLN